MIKAVDIVVRSLVTPGLALLLWTGCGRALPQGAIIFTQVPVDEFAQFEDDPIARLFPSRSRIVALKPGSDIKILTEDFYSARAPEVSYDGRRLLFSGQRRAGDPWQIWVMKIGSGRALQVTTGLVDCTDPAYLAGNHIIYSAKADPYQGYEGGEDNFALYTCNPDGSNLQPVTFHPAAELSPALLHDGRMLYTNLSEGEAPPRIMSGRPDGTDVELFHPGSQGSSWIGRGRETSAGEVVFAEDTPERSGHGRLVSVSMAQPLHSRIELTNHLEGSFHSAFPVGSHSLLVAYRPADNEPYALYEFDTETKALGKQIWRDPAYHTLEPVLVQPRPVPKGIISRVNVQKSTGWYYCQNARFINPGATRIHPGAGKAVAVEIRTIAKILGVVPLEIDGSFHLELPGDTPLQFTTLDGKGRIVVGPSDWIWIRPFEHRGCVGCHEDREQAPYNRVPLAITKPAVTLPAPSAMANAGQPAAAEGSSHE